jgi:triacylglycerol lipase
MIAVWLRCCLAAELAAVALVWAWLVRNAELGVAAAGLLALALLTTANVLMVGAKYTVSRRYGYVPPAELEVGFWDASVAVAIEVCAFVFAFGVIQPFERWWMGSDAVGQLAPGQRPLLMIHGYLCNRGLWWSLRRRLRARGHAVATITLAHPLGGIEAGADELAARIDDLLAETGADRVDLVAHSMGGLVSRAYLRRHGSAKVARIVTIATPHHGTVLARVALGQNAREMQPDSDWLRRLADQETFTMPVLSVWSARDEIVVPQDSARLPGAAERILPASGHLTLVFSPKVLELVDAPS